MFKSSDIQILEKRIFRWTRLYYEAMDEIIKKYPDPDSVLPACLLPHPRQLRLTVTPKVIYLAIYVSEDPWEAVWSDNLVLPSGWMKLYREALSQVEEKRGEWFRLSAFQMLDGDPPGQVRLEGGPERVLISDTAVLRKWSPDQARIEAHNDALSFTIERILDPVGSAREIDAIQEDPKARVARSLGDLIDAFEAVLTDAKREEDVQLFIKDHPYLLDLRAVSVDPKVPLGSEYVTDFVVKLPGSQYLLVELEKAGHALYTRSGNPAAELTHAVRQVEDWLEWSYENLGYLRSRYADIHEPRGLVVIGRRSSLDHKAAKALRRRNVLSKVQVVTYDDLIDDMKAIAINLERGTIPTSAGVAFN